jgi:aldehyde dehydrogenase (NAD+)
MTMIANETCVFLNVVLDLAMEPLVGAVAAGNAVVLKLSEVAPAVSALLAKLIPIYMDKHAVKVVQGDAVMNQELLEQKWDKIFFTGLPIK